MNNNKFERYDQRINKNISKYIGGLVLWAADVCFRAAFAQLGPVSSISLIQFFSVRVRRRPNVTLLSICSRVYCLPLLAFFSKKNGVTDRAAKWEYQPPSATATV